MPPSSPEPQRQPPRRPSPPQFNFGDPLPGLTADELAAFESGKAAFSAVETAEDGIGPVFTDNACGACHSVPAVGGGSERIETRIGAIIGGQFNPLVELGGPLIQDRGIGAGVGVNGPYNFAAEVIPPGTPLVAGRRTTPLFGLGLVEAVPDQVFIDLAAQQRRDHRGLAGAPHIVLSPSTGRPAVGRFGWKSQHANLFDFSGDAYVNEMGVTTPLFPNENPPQGNVAALASNPLPLGVPNEPDNDDLEAFADFMRLLAPPPPAVAAPQPATMPAARADQTVGRRPNQQPPEAMSGARLFVQVGCAVCHVPSLRTGPSPIAALDRKTFWPYSDFLLHDMGSLGDQMVQGQASGRQMRTAPLWGLRAETRLLHDGRARNFTDAILAHAGQGLAARNAFTALPPRDRAALLAFLGSL